MKLIQTSGFQKVDFACALASFGATQYRQAVCFPGFNSFGGSTGLRYNSAYENGQLQFKRNFQWRKMGRKIIFKSVVISVRQLFTLTRHLEFKL